MPPISVMLKPSSSNCNLACKYCFYHSVASARESFSHGFMSEETTTNVIEKALEYAGGHEVYFAFQGGEPLLIGKEFYLSFVTIVAKKNIHGSEIHYGMQTNGTLVDKEWCAIFRENKILVGLSLDGNKPMNCYRVYADGGDSFDAVFEAAALMTREKVDFNILTVVTRKTAENITQIYNCFKKCGFKFLQFIPALKPLGGKFVGDMKEDDYLDNDTFYRYLIKLFKLYYNDFMLGNYHSIRYFDNLFHLARGERAELCGINGYCSRQFVIEGGGNVYPCDFFCLDEYLLGNINDTDFIDLALTKTAKNFVESGAAVKQKCVECEYFRLCRGGCKRQTMDIDFCESYKKFFDFAVPYLQKM